MKIHIRKSDIFRGYTPLGKELTNDKYDWHECVDFGLDLKSNDPEVISGKQLAGPNQWPENQRNFNECPIPLKSLKLYPKTSKSHKNEVQTGT